MANKRGTWSFYGQYRSAYQDRHFFDQQHNAPHTPSLAALGPIFTTEVCGGDPFNVDKKDMKDSTSTAHLE
jgi:hypothetical protein